MPIKFKLDFPIPEQGVIDHFDTLFLLGSCFATKQVEHFRKAGFNTHSNPFGIIYDPLSLSTLLTRIAHQKKYEEADFQMLNDGFFCYEHHGSMRFESLDSAIESCNNLLHTTKVQLEETKCIVLTFGTSLVFYHNELKATVANCHKQANKLFSKKQLSSAECAQAMSQAKQALELINPSIECITTISPVRHIRSGLQENFLSKSTLRLAIAESELKDSYFPAYEIFADELRDYRFAETDLVHPSPSATTYIWERFAATYFSKELQLAVDEVLNFRKLEAHRPRKNNDAHFKQVADSKARLIQKYTDVAL